MTPPPTRSAWRDLPTLLSFTRMDVLVAWRHLRTGDARAPWVTPVVIGALYLCAVGIGLVVYANTLDPGVTVIGPFDLPGTDPGPTPLQQLFGAFGVLTALIGVMFLTFGVLAWFFNLLPTIITMSVLLGCMALVVVLSLMSGLEGDLRDKILAQKAHVKVSRADGRPFEDYMALSDALAAGNGLAGASPYLEGEIMVRSGLNRQGAILTGIIPERQTTVSNLPELVREGDYAFLTAPQDIPDPDPFADEDGEDTPWRLRHLDEQRKKKKRKESRSFEAQANKLGDDDDDATKKLPVPTIPVPEPIVDDPDDDGGWEDPAEELERLGLRDEAPDEASDEASDDEPGGGLLNRLPKPPEGGKVVLEPPTQDELDELDGWEDPAEEIDRLREEGVLPPEAEDGGDGGDDGEDAGDEGGEGEGDGDDEGDDDSGLGISGAREAAAVFPLLIGKELSAELGVRVGAQVQLITPIGRMTPAGRVPGQLVTKVAGVFFSGMYEYDRKNVYSPLAVVQRFLLVGDRVSGIEVKLADVEAIDAGKAEVERIVEQSGRADELIVEDWRDLNRNLFSAMFLEKVAMFIALLFVVLVASFGILASNLMSVMEKAKEIAILKAMGTADQGIMRIFIAEGLVMGLLGSAGGIMMGLGLCWALDRFGLPLNENVYYIEKLPVVINPQEVGLVWVAALAIVCASSLYPALVASRLRPVDGLRHSE